MALRDLDATELARFEADLASLPASVHGKPVTEDRSVYEAAKDRIAQCYRGYDEVIVSWSAGKDSTVLMNLAIEVATELGRLPVQVRFWDEEALPSSVDEYARRVIAGPVADGQVELEWLALPIQHRNACHPDHPNWWPWEPESRQLWCRPLPPESRSIDHDTPSWWPLGADRAHRPSIPVAASVYCATRPGTVAVLMGLRAQESLRRHRIIVSKGGDSWISRRANEGASNLFHCYPIYDWTQDDVWTAIGSFGWDYCDFYDAMEMLGVATGLQRLGPPFGEEPLQRLWTYQRLDPQLWDRMADRVPGARAAALHSRNTLYGFGRNEGEESGRLPGESWEQAINRALKAHDPVLARKTLGRVRMMVTRHYRKTAQPILDVPHPTSGVSWPWLYKLALRGDAKERRTPPIFADPEIYRKRWIEYHDALKEHDGRR